jgi:S-adenosyl methyltransferase
MRRSVDLNSDPARRIRAQLIDVTAANPARSADYLGGARDNFAADRGAARAVVAAAPVVRVMVPACRAFHCRVVRYLVARAGIRQFLDVGAGLATSGRTHEIPGDHGADRTERGVQQLARRLRVFTLADAASS